MKRIVRVAPGVSGSRIRQPDYADDPRSRYEFRQLQLIQPAEIRSLLFAQAAVLCEGKPEPTALPRWWANARLLRNTDRALFGKAMRETGGEQAKGRGLLRRRSS